MATQTNIEWTDFNWSINPNVSESDSLDEVMRWIDTFQLHPVKHILGALRRITTTAGRNNIVGRCASALADRNHMIISRGRSFAVGTKAAKIFEQNFFANRRNGIDVAPSGCGLLTPAVTKFSLSLVKVAIIFFFVLRAFAANTAPKSLFWQSLRAVLTFSLFSVITRAVNRKIRLAFPQFAFCASLHSARCKSEIFFHRHAGLFGGNFNRSFACLHTANSNIFGGFDGVSN